MSFVIYRPQTHPNDRTPVLARYKDRRGLAKAVAKWTKKYPDALVTTQEDFLKNVVKTITVRSMMNGAEVQERSDTPYTCSVESETYWCS